MVKYNYFIQDNKTGKIKNLSKSDYKNLYELYKKYGNSKEVTLNRLFCDKKGKNCYSQEFEGGEWSEREY